MKVRPLSSAGGRTLVPPCPMLGWKHLLLSRLGDTHNLCLAAGAAAVGGGEGGGTGFAEAGLPAAGKGTAHSQRVDAVGVPVAVAVVIIDATIARGPDEDGTEPPTPLGQGEDEQETALSPSSSVLENPKYPCCTSTLLLWSGASKPTGRECCAYFCDPVVKGFHGQHPRPIHVPPIIQRAPAGAVDMDVLRPQAEGLSLHDVCDGTVQHPHTWGGDLAVRAHWV